MRNASSNPHADLIGHLEQVKELLEATIELARAEKSGLQKVRKKREHIANKKVNGNQIEFSMPLRPFIKRYAVGLSGPKKFTLVLAHLTGGSVSKRVALEEVQRCWGRMTAKGLLGMKFNRFYPAAAKDNDWVNTEKSGLYYLRPSWKNIFQ
jgi:hypothetical protein